MKIVHEAYRSKKNEALMQAEQAKYSTVVIGNRQMEGGLQKLVEDLNPLKVYELFRRVSSEVSRFVNRRRRVHAESQDAELLALRPDIGRPEDYLWNYISVPPPCIRPSVASEAGK